MMVPQTSTIILNADDYAMTDGVSRSIEALAFGRRLSATSVMSTMPEWPASALRLRALRDRIAIGLHLNLTLGAPSKPLRNLAPDGAFPALSVLLRRAVLGALDHAEIAAEIERQLDLFEQHLGYPPDHVDGHQHIQVLPVVRAALLDSLARRYKTAPPLVRDPSDAADQLMARGLAGAKAITVKALAAGFSNGARQRGLPVNLRFAGFSAFDTKASYQKEITDELDRGRGRDAGRTPGLSIIMCHPGYADAALAALDPVVERRQQEHDGLMQLEALEGRIWHANRPHDGAPINWTGVGAVA
jgi:chitin disaccharide deacetylase